MGVFQQALRWRRLRVILREALELERSRISPEQADYVVEYLDYNEFGLARSQMLDALSDLDLVPLAVTGELLAEAADLMGLRE